MQKIETTLEKVREDITAFYRPEEHHFVCMQGVDVPGGVETHWVFVPYKDGEEATLFSVVVPLDAEIPSLKALIPSAWSTEAEFYDLFDVKVENTEKGFFLDEDSPQPLRERA